MCHLGYYVDQSFTGWLFVQAEVGALVIERSRNWCKGWALWQVPKRVLILVLTVQAVAVVASISGALLMPVRLVDLERFAILAVLAWAAIELTRHIERKREHARRSSVAYIDTRAVWNFAAVIVLPPALATVMVVFSSVLSWNRVQPRSRNHVMYRWVYTGATVLCGTQAAALVLALGMSNYPGAPATSSMTALFDVGIIVVAAVVRWAVNAGLVMAAIAVSDPSLRVRDLFANFGEQQLLEAGASGLGLVAAVVVVTNPFVLPGIVITVVALHRSLLVNQYQKASRTDTKTGLAAVGRWHEFAEQSLVRAKEHGSSMGLLIVDLDHFKAINDTYGHPFGDQVLRAVADELRAEIRDDDACGRWGGEEFAIALPDVESKRNLHNVAERIRQRIAAVVLEPPQPAENGVEVNITASIGAAIYPAEGIATLDELLLAADTALYDAKNSGRNAVRLSPTVPDSPAEVAASIEKPPHTDGSRPNTI